MGYQLLARSNDTVKRTLLGPKGLSLKWRKRAEIVKSSPYPRVESPQGNELNSVLNMTKAQLAKALSPVVLRDGQEYIGKPSAAFLSRISDDGIDRRIGPYSPLARDKEEHVNVNQGILPKSGQFGCYTVTIPTAWINNAGGDARFDYAVIEFAGCGDFPGRATGWKGLWAAPDEVVTGNRLYVYGHPSDRIQPQIWGDEGSGINNGDYISFFIDAWFGDSGSGLYVYDTDGWPYVVGVLRGATGSIGDDTKPNFGRRITREVFDFIVAYSEL